LVGKIIAETTKAHPSQKRDAESASGANAQRCNHLFRPRRQAQGVACRL
jgi:hypothetical protein